MTTHLPSALRAWRALGHRQAQGFVITFERLGERSSGDRCKWGRKEEWEWGPPARSSSQGWYGIEGREGDTAEGEGRVIGEGVVVGAPSWAVSQEEDGGAKGR